MTDQGKARSLSRLPGPAGNILNKQILRLFSCQSPPGTPKPKLIPSSRSFTHTMSSPFTTLPATATDIPALSRLLCYSKQTLAITRLLQEDFGNETLLLARCVRAIEGSLNDPLAENVKMVDNNSGEIIGHLTMTIRKKTEDKEARSVPAITTGLNAEVLKAVNEAVSELKKIRDEEYLGKISCITLSNSPTPSQHRNIQAHHPFRTPSKQFQHYQRSINPLEIIRAPSKLLPPSNQSPQIKLLYLNPTPTFKPQKHHPNHPPPKITNTLRHRTNTHPHNPISPPPWSRYPSHQYLPLKSRINQSPNFPRRHTNFSRLLPEDWMQGYKVC